MDWNEWRKRERIPLHTHTHNVRSKRTNLKPSKASKHWHDIDKIKNLKNIEAFHRI